MEKIRASVATRWMRSIAVSAALLGAASSHAQQVSQPSVYLLESIECRGNERTSCDYIQRKLQLAVNRNIDDEVVQNARLRLSALPIFQSVRLYLEKGSSRGRAQLIVEVVEAGAWATELTAYVSFHSVDVEPAPIQRDFDTWSQSVSGRISHQNLFGRQKILDVGGFAARAERDYDEGMVYSFRSSYIDPALAGIDRLFFSAGVALYYTENDSRFVTGPFTTISEATSEQYSAGLSIGFRVWDYSYVVAGVTYQHLDFETESRRFGPAVPSLPIASEESRHNSTWRLGYGWDSEDDAYFPTRGSRFSAAVIYSDYDLASPQPNWNVAYKHTWSTRGRSTWSVNVGGEPAAPADRLRPTSSVGTGGLALTYARSIASTDFLGGLSRGRWYAQLGTGPVELRRDGHIGGHPTTASLRLGMRLDTRMLGIVELYAMASRDWPRQSN